MKVYTDTLTHADIGEAVRMARSEHGCDIYLDELSSHKGRKRERTITMYCGSEHGRFARNNKRGGGPYNRAASWTAYGWVIAELYRRDPNAIIGHYYDHKYPDRRSIDIFIEMCRSEHDRHARYRPSDKSRQDISFLELVQ